MSTWERGARMGPPLSFAGVSRVFAKKKGCRQAHAGLSAAFSRSGPLARVSRAPAASCMSPTRVARFRRVGVLKGASGSMPSPGSLSGQGRGASSQGFAGGLLVRLSDIAGKSSRMFPRTPNMYQGIGPHATGAGSQPFAGSRAILLPGRPPRCRGALAGSGCRAWSRWPCGGRWRCCGRCRARRR